MFGHFSTLYMAVLKFQTSVIGELAFIWLEIFWKTWELPIKALPIDYNFNKVTEVFTN